MLAWRSRFDAERHLRVVDVKGAQPLEPDLRVELVDERRRGPRRRGCRRPRRTGGSSRCRRRAARRLPASSISSASSSSVAPERPLGAGGVLEQQRAALGVRRAPRGSPWRRASSRRRAARPCGPRRGGRRRPRRSRRRRAARASSDAQRLRCGSPRSLARAVDQVDRRGSPPRRSREPASASRKAAKSSSV